MTQQPNAAYETVAMTAMDIAMEIINRIENTSPEDARWDTVGSMLHAASLLSESLAALPTNTKSV